IEIRADCKRVVARHLRVPGIRECRIEAGANVRDSLVKRPIELIVGPCANSRLAIRGDIGRVDHTEWRLDRAVAGEREAALIGVTGLAVAGLDEILSALDLAKRKLL